MPRYYKPEDQGDSRPDTQKHIDLVNENGKKFCDKFLERLTHHDASKLEEPERKYFDKGTPQLKNSTYGDKSYDDAKERIKPGLEHHYAENDHHPEHFGNQGISGTKPYKWLEMWIDWTAAVKRHADGNIFNSLMYNRGRFHIDDQLFSILLNTATEDFPDQMDTANEKFQKYLEAEFNRDAPDEENTDAGSDS